MFEVGPAMTIYDLLVEFWNLCLHAHATWPFGSSLGWLMAIFENVHKFIVYVRVQRIGTISDSDL